MSISSSLRQHQLDTKAEAAMAQAYIAQGTPRIDTREATSHSLEDVLDVRSEEGFPRQYR